MLFTGKGNRTWEVRKEKDGPVVAEIQESVQGELVILVSSRLNYAEVESIAGYMELMDGKPRFDGEDDMERARR